MAGVIYLTTDVATSAERIVGRGRDGESAIPVDALEAQHVAWLPVCRVTTQNREEAITCVRKFVDSLATSV